MTAADVIAVRLSISVKSSACSSSVLTPSSRSRYSASRCNVTEAVTRYDYDTLLVAGQMAPRRPSSPGFIEILRQAGAQSRRVASICTGAFLLAEAGLLDGKRATTHWALARDLQRMYPKVRVEEDRIHVQAGPMLYELLVPAADLTELQASLGETLTLHTIFYLGGDPSRGGIEPTLIGFLRPPSMNVYTRRDRCQ